MPKLGQALGIDGHAVAVFVEAELRASVLFQANALGVGPWAGGPWGHGWGVGGTWKRCCISCLYF